MLGDKCEPHSTSSRTGEKFESWDLKQRFDCKKLFRGEILHSVTSSRCHSKFSNLNCYENNIWTLKAWKCASSLKQRCSIQILVGSFMRGHFWKVSKQGHQNRCMLKKYLKNRFGKLLSILIDFLQKNNHYISKGTYSIIQL